jgi:hypothetical protein
VGPAPVRLPAPVNVSHLCPPETSILAPQAHREVTRIRDGENAFQTVKRFRLAEQKKNSDLRRLYQAYEACRKAVDVKKDAADQALIGGIR